MTYRGTSIKNRIFKSVNPCGLELFVGVKQDVIGIPYRLKDCVELLDLAGRIIRDDKRGYIHGSLPKILDRLSLDINS